jgi:hypothetical protein
LEQQSSLLAQALPAVLHAVLSGWHTPDEQLPLQHASLETHAALSDVHATGPPPEPPPVEAEASLPEIIPAAPLAPLPRPPTFAGSTVTFPELPQPSKTREYTHHDVGRRIRAVSCSVEAPLQTRDRRTGVEKNRVFPRAGDAVTPTGGHSIDQGERSADQRRRWRGLPRP